MELKEQIIKTIYEVVDEVNRDLPPEQQLSKSQETVLFGQNATLDSLGLVSFVVAAEQKVEEKFGKPVTLTDERAMSQHSSPFRSINTLIDYIAALLQESYDDK